MNSGPAPDPTALRRSRDARTWTKLPAAGRVGPTPAWPIEPDAGEAALTEWMEAKVTKLQGDWAAAEDGRVARRLARELEEADQALVIRKARLAARDDAELALWTELWTYPQAIVWEVDRSHHQVAMYVRATLEARRPEAKANDRTLARQYADSLMLTIPALHSMHYVIDAVLPGAGAADLTGELGAKIEDEDADGVQREPRTGRRSRFQVYDGEGESA